MFVLRPPADSESLQFLSQIQSSDEQLVRRAVQALSMAEDERILPRLYDLLSTKSLQLQEIACDGLSYYRGNREVVAKLVEKATRDENEMARIYALDALEELGDAACITALAQICQDDRYPRASVVAARILMNTFQAAEHLDKIEAVMRRHFGPRGDPTWAANIRELRKKAESK